MNFPSRYVVTRTILISLAAASISISVSTGMRMAVGAKADTITIIVRFILPFVIAIPLGGMLFTKMERLNNSYRTLIRQANDLARRANTDPLTGLLNRSSFIEQFELAMRHGIKGVFVLVDLDYLKRINDSFGHLAGDDAIVETSKALVAALGDCDLVARIGGDEFCAFVRLEGKLFPKDLVEAIEAAVAKVAVTTGSETPVEVSVTCGYSACRSGMSFRDALEEADRALYENKRRRSPLTA